MKKNDPAHELFVLLPEKTHFDISTSPNMTRPDMSLPGHTQKNFTNLQKNFTYVSQAKPRVSPIDESGTREAKTPTAGAVGRRTEDRDGPAGWPLPPGGHASLKHCTPRGSA